MTEMNQVDDVQIQEVDAKASQEEQSLCDILRKFPKQILPTDGTPKTVWDKYNTGSVKEREAYYRMGFRRFRTKKFCDCKGECTCPDPVPPPDSFEHDLKILFGEEYVQRSRLLFEPYMKIVCGDSYAPPSKHKKESSDDIHRFVVQQFFPVGMSKYEDAVWDALVSRCGRRPPRGVLALVYKEIIEEYEMQIIHHEVYDRRSKKERAVCRKHAYMMCMRKAFNVLIDRITYWSEPLDDSHS